MVLIILTWRRGSGILVNKTRRTEVPLDTLFRSLEKKPPHIVSGTAVFLTSDPEFAPTALLHNLKHNKVLHEHNVILTIITGDTPRVPEEERVTQQGAGVALTIMDSLTISNRSLIDEFEAAAKKRDIPSQLSILTRGGTDAGPMQRARGGYKTMTLSVPTRYIHTVTECIHKRDLQAAIDLLAAWLET